MSHTFTLCILCINEPILVTFFLNCITITIIIITIINIIIIITIINNNNNNNNCLKSNIQKVQWTIINDIHI